MCSLTRPRSFVFLAAASGLLLGFSDLLLLDISKGKLVHPLVIVPQSVLVLFVRREISERRSLKAFVVFVAAMLLSIVRILTLHSVLNSDVLVVRGMFTVVLMAAVLAPASWPICKLDGEAQRE